MTGSLRWLVDRFRGSEPFWQREDSNTMLSRKLPLNQAQVVFCQSFQVSHQRSFVASARSCEFYFLKHGIESIDYCWKLIVDFSWLLQYQRVSLSVEQMISSPICFAGLSRSKRQQMINWRPSLKKVSLTQKSRSILRYWSVIRC